MTVTYHDVQEAAKRIDGVAHRTPIVRSSTLDKLVGATVFLKCENLQRMGAFKFRGAYNRIVQLNETERKAGVVAYSSGNHAQGVALAAQLLGVPATIVMPRDAPVSKLAATRGYGAEVVLYERSEENRAVIAQQIAQKTGATIVPPYDDVHIAAGAGTAALELLEDEGPLGIVIVPVGGAGLLSGTCIAAHGIDPNIKVWGVEPESGDDTKQSLEQGKRVLIDVPKTIADGLQTQSPGVVNFPIIQQHAAGIVTVTDNELIDAMRFAFERLKMVIEPSGAAGLAAVLSKKLDVQGKRCGIVITGGNVDAERYAQLLSSCGQVPFSAPM